ncbi:MAG: RNA polymerase sigma factor [Traorella sp.]
MEINVKEINDQLIDQTIKKIASDDTHALADLYDMTQQKVYGYILSILKNKYDAQDVLHDTYVAIYQSSKNYRTSGRPLSWILTIAKNLSLLKIRENSREVSIPYEDFEECIDYRNDISIEEKLVLRDFMKILSEEERQIVYLHSVIGYKHHEIAQVMNLRLSTVLSKYHRAIKKLRNEYEKGEK